MSRILSAATAVPEFLHTQQEIQDMFRPHFGKLLDSASRRGIFAHSGVKTRHSVEPRDFYFRKDFPNERNETYRKHALALAHRCICEALGSAGINAEAIGHFFSVTTTGLLTPSLEAHLAHELLFSRKVKRTPIFGAGCAGGVVALARAAEWIKHRPDDNAVVVSVELCSLTFDPRDRGMTQLVAAALFGDGAAAVVLGGGKKEGAVEVVDSASCLFPDSLDAMGWDFSDGMRLVLSPRIPELIESGLRAAVDPFLQAHGLSLRDIGTFLIHPGSLKIIKSCERALGIGAEDTRLSREFLERHGNLSSASILFILKEALAERAIKSGHALVLAMGPGFAAEMVLLRTS